MSSLRYFKQKYDQERFVELPQTYEYFKLIDREIYPRIFHKTQKEWREYCLLNENNQRYYARDERGKEYYPKDNEGRFHILEDVEGKPKFIKDLNLSFVHLDKVWFPFDIYRTSNVDIRDPDYGMYVTRPDLSVGDFYITVMTERQSDEKYSTWKNMGLTDERFRKDGTFQGSDAYVESDSGRRFVFALSERRYIGGESFYDSTKNLQYVTAFNGQKLYFRVEGKYFVFDNKGAEHFILSLNQYGCYAYTLENGLFTVYYPEPRSLIHSEKVDFNELTQELDDDGNVISFFQNDDGTKTKYIYDGTRFVKVPLKEKVEKEEDNEEDEEEEEDNEEEEEEDNEEEEEEDNEEEEEEKEDNEEEEKKEKEDNEEKEKKEKDEELKEVKVEEEKEEELKEKEPKKILPSSFIRFKIVDDIPDVKEPLPPQNSKFFLFLCVLAILCLIIVFTL
jgi:hypothetical protein